MEVCTDFSNWGRGTIEACRTCGTYFDIADGLIKPIFMQTSSGVEAVSDAGMAEILQQMSAWNLLVSKEDGRPQYMCISCIAEFQRLLKFKCSCLETHEQYVGHQLTNEINIKKELDIQSEEKFCGFIYLDSDEEVSDEDGSRRVSAAFDIPHVPIKQEHMARVPAQQSEMEFEFMAPQAQLLLPPVGIKTEADYEFKFRTASEEENPDPDTVGISYASESNANAMSYNSETNPNAIYENERESNAAMLSYEHDNESDEEEVVKFTYDDDDEDAATIPQPIQSTSVFCKLCYHEFPSQELYEKHMQHMHLFKDWECHLCGKKFINSKDSLIKLHIKFHKLQRRLKCPICGFFCNSKETLKVHERAVHSRTVCEYCGKVMRPNMLQSHMMKHLHEHEAAMTQELTSAESPGTSSADLKQMPEEGSAQKNLKVVNHLHLTATSSAVLKLEGLDQPAGQELASAQSPVPFSPMPSAEKKLKLEHLSDERLPVPISPVPLHSLPTEKLPVDFSTLKQEEEEQQHKSEYSPPVTYSPVMPICVIQCAFCSDKFEEAKQLQDHVLAKHKDMNSPPPKIKPPLQFQRPPEAMDVDNDESSFKSDSMTSAKDSSTSSVTTRGLNSSSQNSYDESYCKCHICGKAFDLKIKLNRHLKQHKKAPF